MTNPTLGYYTDADTIRQALRNHGSMTRAELVQATDLSREKLAKSLYALRKQGDVVMDGDLVHLVTTEDMPIPATETAIEATQDSVVVPTYQNGTENASEGKNQPLDFVEAITAVVDELTRLRRENAEIRAANTRLTEKCEELRMENADIRQRHERIRTILDPICAA